MHKFPSTAVATEEVAIQALTELEEKILAETKRAGLWQLLSDAAAAAMEGGFLPKAKALWILSDACSMSLRWESINEPFGPAYTNNRERTSALSDLQDADVELIAALAFKVSNPVFQARLADIAWLCGKPRNPAYAHLAIDAYAHDLPTQDNWVETLPEWRRAVTLCKQLRSAADEKRKLLAQRFIQQVLVAIPMEPFGLQVAQALFQMGFAETPDREVADLLIAKAEAVQTEEDFHRAQRYFILAADFYNACQEPSLRADAKTSAALTFEKIAGQRLKQGLAGVFVAGAFIEDAIQALRHVPREHRELRQVDQHIERLLSRLIELGTQTVKAMPVIRTKAQDITDLVRGAEEFVHGLELDVAIEHFSVIHPGSQRRLLRQSAEERLSQGFLHKMFPSTHYGRDGRVVAKTPAIDFGKHGSPDNETRIWFEMVDIFKFDVDIATRALIAPALRTITEEHRVSKNHLVMLVASSPVIPSERVQAFANGLFAGFELDFLTALYLLAPQLENLVRLHFKHAGLTTTNLSADGVENELGLSSLMEYEDAGAVLGEDLAFEIEALFCSPYGPNIRNEVAHGLLDHGIAYSSAGLYAWWIILKLVVRARLMPQVPGRESMPSQDAGTNSK